MKKITKETIISWINKRPEDSKDSKKPTKYVDAETIKKMKRQFYEELKGFEKKIFHYWFEAGALETAVESETAHDFAYYVHTLVTKSNELLWEMIDAYDGTEEDK